MVSRKTLRFGKELRAFKFYSFQFFQFYTLKINKQLSLKTVSIINLFITYLFIIKISYLSETERIGDEAVLK
jgi:hypothetical protein